MNIKKSVNVDDLVEVLEKSCNGVVSYAEAIGRVIILLGFDTVDNSNGTVSIVELNLSGKAC